MIIRALLVMIEAAILYICQTSVFSSLSLAGVVPNLLIILVCSVAFMRGRVYGSLTGFFCGLIIDVCYGSFLGIFSFLYLTVGYLSGFANKIYDEEDYTTPLFIISIGELLYNIGYYFFFCFLKGRLDIGFYFFRYMVPRVIYTLLVALLLYKLFNTVHIFLMRFDKE